MRTLAILFLAVLGAGGADAHTVDLGKEIARGACSAVQTVDSRSLLLFSSETSRIQYYDGRIPVSAVIIPSKPLPEGKPDDLMSACARRAAEDIERSKAGAGAQPEEAFRKLLNACLTEKKASYEATAVLFRRGPVECGASAPPQTTWQEELRAGLKWCQGKDNIFSRNLCEYRERNRFCSPENRWGKVPECEK